MLLEGLHIPLTTPFHRDGRLNVRKLAANVERYSRTPAAGLIVCGPSGEPTLLTDAETREALRSVAEAAAPEKALVAGIARDSVAAVLDLAEFAAELGYDTILVGVPSVLAGKGGNRQNKLLTYFRTIADHSPVPIILLSVCMRIIDLDAVVALAEHPNIIGAAIGPFGVTDVGTDIKIIVERTAAIKQEAKVTHVFAAVTARMARASSHGINGQLVSASSLAGASTAIAEPPRLPALRTRTKTVGFQIIAGSTETMLAGLQAGAIGIAPAFAAAAPQACFEVYASWKDGDQPLAEEKQARIRAGARIGDEVAGISIGRLKFACDLNGYFGGLPRLPHLPASGGERAALEELMKPLRN